MRKIGYEAKLFVAELFLVISFFLHKLILRLFCCILGIRNSLFRR